MGRRKKKRKRGSNTHGHGSSKKNRGAGSRGGRGNAGSGKKAGHKKVSAIKKDVEDKGFTSQQQRKGDKPVTVNIGDLDTMLPRLKDQGIASEENGELVIDLTKTEYDKVLGKGTLSVEATVKADTFSSGAKKKLEAHGSTPVEPSNNDAQEQEEA